MPFKITSSPIIKELFCSILELIITTICIADTITPVVINSRCCICTFIRWRHLMKRYMNYNKRYDHVYHRGLRYTDTSHAMMVTVMVLQLESEKNTLENLLSNNLNRRRDGLKQVS